MSYELLYGRFIVKKDNGELVPYIIHGSNNVFSYSGKRERNVSNLFTDFRLEFDRTNLRKYLSEVYKVLASESSGFLKGVPKTEKGFIEGFYKKIIPESEFDSSSSGEYMETILKMKFKTERKRQSYSEIIESVKTKELMPLTESSKRYLSGITIVGYDSYKFPVGIGKIRKLYSGEDYGFFPKNMRRRYISISRISYFRIVGDKHPPIAETRKILSEITDEEKYVKFLSEHPELRTKPVKVTKYKRKRSVVRSHKRTKPRTR